jgi:hypothetical protein
MNRFRPPSIPKKHLTRWRHPAPLARLQAKGQGSKALAAAGGAAAVTLGAAIATVVVGGLVVMGLGALIAGGLLLTGYWFKAKRSGIWLHVLVDSDDAVISLALPIPISLIRLGLRRAPISDDAADIARLILDDPELLKTLRHDAIEVIVDDGPEHIEVVIGPRRKQWRAFQFNPVRSFSKHASIAPLEED